MGGNTVKELNKGLRDLNKRHQELHERNIKLFETYSKYMFEDAFVCDLIIDERLRVDAEKREIEKAIERCKESLEEVGA
jgi:hypothetical protein